MSSLLVVLSVGVHALVMRELYDRLCYAGRLVWLRLSLIVLILLLAHSLQIVMFGLAYHLMGDPPNGLAGVYDGSLTDALYFSAAVYTTVGFGDITPSGYLRLLVSFEALLGLVLIAWSASFTFVAMSRLAKPGSNADHDDREAGDNG
ncbi:MAG: potassium channel family protein [Planctomycetota bacterium]